VPAKTKLTNEQVKLIRRRVQRGEQVTELASEFAVNRKTIRRRLDALELAEAKSALAEIEKAQRTISKRLRLQIEGERRKLRQRERQLKLERIRATHIVSELSTRLHVVEADRHALRTSKPSSRRPTGEREWLDTRKNLSGRALAEANGLIRLRNPEGTVCVWCERTELDPLIETGWRIV
jgi:hypothetical protein